MKKKGIFKSDSIILFLLILPVLVYYIVFQYLPIIGLSMAFIDYNPSEGFFGSEWVGLRWFKDYLGSFYFLRTFKNTILLSGYSLLWGYPIPIIFALLVNEVRKSLFKKFIQTVSFFPHFISTVVIVGMIYTFLAKGDGIVNNIIVSLGGQPISFLSDPKWFRTVFITTSIWQSFGYNSILYLGTLSTIDPQLYNAAEIDGANRFQKILYITLPGIQYTAIIVLLLNLGKIMTVNFEKVLLMYNPAIYETADVISTFVYRKGILDASFGYATAVGLFNSMINLALLLVSNKITKKLTSSSIF